MFYFLEFCDVEMHFGKDDTPQLPYSDVPIHQPCLAHHKSGGSCVGMVAAFLDAPVSSWSIAEK